MTTDKLTPLPCVLSDYLMENGQQPVMVPTEAYFLKQTNEAARKRLFDAGDYRNFIRAATQAANAAMACEMFYEQDSAGGVANSYGSTTTTARWGVWSTPTRTIICNLGRPSVSGRFVPHAFAGGNASYRKWFNQKQDATATIS